MVAVFTIGLVGFALDPADESLFTGHFEFLRKGFSSSEADLCVVVPCMGSRTYPGGPAPNCYYYMNRISASEPLKAIFDPDSLYRQQGRCPGGNHVLYDYDPMSPVSAR